MNLINYNKYDKFIDKDCYLIKKYKRKIRNMFLFFILLNIISLLIVFYFMLNAIFSNHQITFIIQYGIFGYFLVQIVEIIEYDNTLKGLLK